jgi:hypothetical protein
MRPVLFAIPWALGITGFLAHLGQFGRPRRPQASSRPQAPGAPCPTVPAVVSGVRGGCCTGAPPARRPPSIAIAIALRRSPIIHHPSSRLVVDISTSTSTGGFPCWGRGLGFGVWGPQIGPIPSAIYPLEVGSLPCALSLGPCAVGCWNYLRPDELRAVLVLGRTPV